MAQFEKDVSRFNNDARRSGVTDSGRAWLTTALDPFHDSDLQPAGYPDISTTATIVQLVKLQMQVGPPVNNGSNIWDCNISLLPSFSDQNLTIGSISNGTLSPTNPNPVFPMTGVTACSVTSGQSMWSGVTTDLVSTLDPSYFLKGACRVVAAGFEVVNSTADMWKQGQVTVYRQPTFQTDVFAAFPDGDTTQNLPATILKLPPGTLEDAQMLFGSRSWAASDGAYIVGRLNNTSNPLKQPSNQPIVYADASFSAQNGLTSDYAYYTVPLQCAYVAPFDISGAYFTGLSPQTSLTVTARFYIERAPSSSDADLALLAQPSTCYDAEAIEMYSRAICHLPPGVQQDENDLGDWFGRVAGAVSKVAPKIGKVISYFPGMDAASPFGEAIGKAASKAAEAMVKRREKLDKKSNPKVLVGSASNLKPAPKKRK